MSGWTGDQGTFGPGPLMDWVQGFVHNMANNLKAMGYPRPDMLEQLDEFSLRSLKRHIEARRADLDELLTAVDSELTRRQGDLK